jgi:hypothetical protein
MPYPVFDIPPGVRDRSEPMGTKPKFWFTHTDGRRWLFKFNRPGHGEDWSEKITTECAEALGLSHAIVELATFEDQPGVMALDFTERRAAGILVHGNELLGEIVGSAYPTQTNFKVSEHTVDRVMQILGFPVIRLPPGLTPPPDILTAADLFVGYLLLDALVGNTDRHHANWALLAKPTPRGGPVAVSIAPTFDHASSLGRELSDHERHERLTTRDRNRTVARYLARAESRFYRAAGEPKPLSPHAAFLEAAKTRPLAARAWLTVLKGIADEQFQQVVQEVPAARITPEARAFAAEVLSLNRQSLLGIP